VSLEEVQITDDLATSFPYPALCSVVSLESSFLTVSDDFDGVNEISLLTGTDSLGVDKSGTVQMQLCISPQSNVSSYSNYAFASGRTSGGIRVADRFQDGINPDPDGDSDPGNDDQATIFSLANIEVGGAVQTAISLTDTDTLTLDTFSLTAFVSITGFTAQVQMTSSDVGLDSMSISANGTLGMVRLNSALSFDPSNASFTSVQGGAAFAVLDVDITNIVYVALPQTASYTSLSISGSSNGFSAQGSFRFGICPFEFQNANVCGTWEWPQCDTAANACALFSGSDGFVSATVSLSDLTILEDITALQTTFGATLAFTTEETAFSHNLRFQPDWLLCANVELLGEVPSLGTMLFYGLVGEYALANGVTFYIAESFSEEKNSSVTGKAEYWEALKVEGPLPACCGDNGSFAIGAYFGDAPSPPVSLFAFELFTASVDIPLSEGFDLALNQEFPTNGIGWTFSVQFLISW